MGHPLGCRSPCLSCAAAAYAGGWHCQLRPSVRAPASIREIENSRIVRSLSSASHFGLSRRPLQVARLAGSRYFGATFSVALIGDYAARRKKRVGLLLSGLPDRERVWTYCA